MKELCRNQKGVIVLLFNNLKSDLSCNEQYNKANQIELEDVYSSVTHEIIDNLESGTTPWRKPWSTAQMAQNIVRPLRWNNAPYTGVNVIILWAKANEMKYETPHWMTLKQASSMRAVIHEGENPTRIVYAHEFVKEDTDSNGQLQMRRIPFVRSYWVYNASQINGLAPTYYQKPQLTHQGRGKRIKRIDNFIGNTKACIKTGTSPYYLLSSDKIVMPPLESFLSKEAYYAALAHEMTHWTRHHSRLNRDFGSLEWGDKGYALEELVAELGSCFLASDFGIEPKPLPERTAYIKHWLDAFRGDKKLIFLAASYAQKAVEYLYSCQNR